MENSPKMTLFCSQEDSLEIFANSKQRLEELTKVFVECQPNCVKCEDLIQQLDEHIRASHIRNAEYLESVSSTRENFGTSVYPDLFRNKSNTQYEQDQSDPKGPTSHSTRKRIKVRVVPFETDYSLSGHSTFPPENKHQDDHFMQQEEDLPEHLSDVEYKCDVELLTDDEPFRFQEQDQFIEGKTKRPQELGRTRSCRRTRMLANKTRKKESLVSLKSKPEKKSRVRNHRKPGRHICSICKIEFPKARCLFGHFESEHKNSMEKPYQCNICDKTYASLGDLNGHCKSSHPISKPHVCDICSKEFSMIGRLKIHMRSHSGQRPYICQICGKCFVTSGHLAKHIRTHTLEKPHACEICGKRYAVPELLTIHRRTHTGEKPFMCHECSKCFTTNRCLKNHIKIHQGLKAFVCEHCGKAFTLKTTLQIHSKIHATGKHFTCDICGEKFPLQNQLNSHRITAHMSENSVNGQKAGFPS